MTRIEGIKTIGYFCRETACGAPAVNVMAPGELLGTSPRTEGADSWGRIALRFFAGWETCLQGGVMPLPPRNDLAQSFL